MATPPSGIELALEGVRLVSSLLYVVVAAFILRRDVDRESRLAQYGFAAWWAALGLIGFSSLPTRLGVNLAELGLGLWRAYIYVTFPLFYLALAGLVYYLLYIYTGRHRMWVPVGVFYLGMLALTIWLVEGFGPYIGTDEQGELAVQFATEHPQAVLSGFAFAFIVPPLAAAAFFFLLIFKLEEPVRRYRVAMISSGIILWFGYSLLNSIIRAVANVERQGILGQAVSQGLGLLAALLVVLAYAPPKAWRRRLGITGATPA